jgi:hypothetical protein
MSYTVPTSELTALKEAHDKLRFDHATLKASVLGVIEALDSFSNEITREEAARRLKKALEEV